MLCTWKYKEENFWSDYGLIQFVDYFILYLNCSCSCILALKQDVCETQMPLVATKSKMAIFRFQVRFQGFISRVCMQNKTSLLWFNSYGLGYSFFTQAKN